MSNKSVTPDEFAKLGTRAGSVAVRSSGTLTRANSSGRTISYIFSDASVGRDNHVIQRGAWDLKNFEKNRTFLWAHDQSSPPIGKVIDISELGGQLRGTVEYAPADLSPFADSIYRMVRDGYLSATSVSWLPKEWKYSSDRSRPGGIDFSRVELLEVSQVPVPALPTALATARAAGINTGPIYAWAERMLDSGGLATVSRMELESLRKAARSSSSSPRGGSLAERNAAARGRQLKAQADLLQCEREFLASDPYEYYRWKQQSDSAAATGLAARKAKARRLQEEGQARRLQFERKFAAADPVEYRRWKAERI